MKKFKTNSIINACTSNLKLLVGLFCFFYATSGWLWAEFVSYRIDEQGLYHFQIHDVDENQTYRLELKNALDENQIHSIEGFTTSTLYKKLEASWLPGDLEGIFVPRLYRGSELVYEGSLDGNDIRMPDEYVTTTASIDRKENKITWRVNRPSLMRVFASVSPNMIIATLQPWHFSPVGSRNLSWDFRDSDSGVYFGSFRGLGVIVQYIQLPEHLVVVGTPLWKDFQTHPAFAAIDITEIEIEFDAAFLTDTMPSPTESEELTHVSSGSAIRVELSEETNRALARQRYEIGFFLDGVFLHEESQGVSPYTYVLPNLGQESGQRILTVVVMDYAGNFSTRTIPIWYQNKTIATHAPESTETEGQQ